MRGHPTFLDPATWAEFPSLGRVLWIPFPDSYLLARCLHLWHKILPRWVWEDIPDPANSNSRQPHIEVSKKEWLVRNLQEVGGCWDSGECVGALRENGAHNHSLLSSQEVPQAQPPGDLPTLEVQEMEPLPVIEPPQASFRLDSGYEKHFLPTPEELCLLGSRHPGPRFRPEMTPGQETGCSVDS